MSGKRVQLWSLYSVFGFIVLFLIGWVLLARMVPPPSPADDPEQIGRFFRDHLFGIRVGMVLSLFASALLLPWGGAICAQMLRVEGPRAPLAWAWAAAQGCVVIEFVYPCAFWLMAAFRPDNASRVQTFDDLGWLPFLGIVCTGMFQMVALAVITLRDQRAQPVYPRWFSYFQLWCALGVGLTFGVWIFKTGPLAWDGLIGFWIPVTVYFVWVVVTTIVTGRAINHDDVQCDGRTIADRVAALEAELAAMRPQPEAPRSQALRTV
ncbi:hypothetical protein [Mycobacterium sp.]|uniref:hypothetical protein n=1 Tax=Mycobacterium sp. TaxID=1785 RepID=UPI0025F6AB89|nr:hypothetical protein [Mycobacterium sp.]